MMNKNNPEDWEWHWKLAIKLAKNEGIPTEEEYWEGLTQKIMNEVEHLEIEVSRSQLQWSAKTESHYR